MDLIALLLLILLACMLALVAPVLRVRESSHDAAGRSLVIQSLPSAVALAWWAMSLSDLEASAPGSFPGMGAAPALAFGLQLVATPLALRPSSVTLGARGVYTVLSAVGAVGIVVFAGVLQFMAPSSEDRSKIAVENKVRTACVALNSATFRRSRADLEQICTCAGRSVIAEVGIEALRKASSSGADAMDVANVHLALASAQSSCVMEQFGK